MKIALITDTHIGARNSSRIFREQMKSFLSDFLDDVKTQEIETILHLGDFFDSRTSLSLVDIDFVMNWFIPKLNDSGAHMIVIAGNHDVYYRNTNQVNSLSILQGCKNITIVQNDIYIHKTDNKNFVMCPWLNDENQERLLEDLAHYANNDHVLCLHGEFAGMKMYKNSKLNEHGLDVKIFSKFHHVLSGHFHHPSVYGNIEYMGAAHYMNWQDYDDWRGYFLYDVLDDSYEKIINPYCPFIEITYNDDRDDLEGKIVRVIVEDEVKHSDLKDYIHSIEKQKPVSVDVIDLTIFQEDDNVEELNDTEESQVVSKELLDYFSEYLTQLSLDEKTVHSLEDKFSNLYELAKTKMKEIE